MIFRSTVLTLGLCFAAQQATAQNTDAKPNVLVIMADNLGTNDVPGYFTERIGLDEMQGVKRNLIEKGILFTDAHATPMGWASRYSFLSGNYPHRGRLVGGVAKPNYIGNQFLDGQNSIAQTFQDAGYQTFMAGSYLIGGKLPLKEKDEANKDVTCSEETTGNDIYACHFRDSRHDWTEEIGGGPRDIGFEFFHFSPTGNYAGPYGWMQEQKNRIPKVRNDTVYVDMTDIAEETLKFQQQHMWTANDVGEDWDPRKENFVIYSEMEKFLKKRNTNKPFFSYLALKSVGSPEFESDTANAFHGAWLDDKNGSRCAEKFEIKGNMANPCPNRLGNKHSKTKHGSNINEVDVMVKWLIKTLEVEQLLENTIIVLTSDSGSGYYEESWGKQNSNGNFKGTEGDIFEGGHRVPLIIRWDKGAGKNKGQRRGRMFSITDLYRTLAGLAGIEVDEGQAVDSKNMAGYLTNATYFKKGSNKKHKRTFLGSWVVDQLYGHKYESMRWKDLKLIRNVTKKENPWLLFNLTSDKFEDTDIYPTDQAVLNDIRPGSLGKRIKKLKKKLDRVGMCRDNNSKGWNVDGKIYKCDDFNKDDCFVSKNLPNGETKQEVNLEVYYNCGVLCKDLHDNAKWCEAGGELIDNYFTEKYGIYLNAPIIYEGQPTPPPLTNEAAMRMYTPAGYQASTTKDLGLEYLQAVDPEEETIWYWDDEDEDDDDDDDETATSAAPIITGTSQLVAGLATFFLTIIL